MDTVNERVERGAALLDEKRPGWPEAVDLGRLNIRSTCDCIAGQLGGFRETTQSLGLYGVTEDVMHGFEADDDDAEYAALTDAWRDLIQQRRLARVLA